MTVGPRYFDDDDGVDLEELDNRNSYNDLARKHEALGERVAKLEEIRRVARIHHHDGCKGCFAVQSLIKRYDRAYPDPTRHTG